MRVCTCPHCGNPRMVTSKVPKDMVVVMPCPNCHELVVLFRSKAIAMNKQVLENGTRDERKAHLADIISEFLDEGLFGFPTFGGQLHGHAGESGISEADGQPGDRTLREPITEKELDEFVRIDLKRIDEASYFKKFFG